LEVANGGNLYVENAADQWYEWTGSGWSATSNPGGTVAASAATAAAAAAPVSGPLLDFSDVDFPPGGGGNGGGGSAGGSGGSHNYSGDGVINGQSWQHSPYADPIGATIGVSSATGEASPGDNHHWGMHG
jgi:large repetitive protein